MDYLIVINIQGNLNLVSSNNLTLLKIIWYPLLNNQKTKIKGN